MFNIEIDVTPLWILSQVFAFFALCCLVYAMVFTKKKWQTQLGVMGFNALMSVCVALQTDWVMFGIHSLAVARDIVFIWKDRYYPDNRAISISVIILFMTASVIVGIVTYVWWFQVFLICASMFVDYGSWAKGVHMIRISRFVFSALAIVNFLTFRFNPTGVVISVFAITSVIIFYLRYFRNRGKIGDASVAQQVAHVIGNDEVTGSNPVGSSTHLEPISVDKIN